MSILKILKKISPKKVKKLSKEKAQKNPKMTRIQSSFQSSLKSLVNKIVLTNLKIKNPRKVIKLLIHLINLKSQQIKSPRMFRKIKEIIF